jgi:hypothetical protein
MTLKNTLYLYDKSMTIKQDRLRAVTDETGLSGGGDYYFWSGNFIKLK